MMHPRALLVAVVLFATISANLPTLAREIYRPQSIDAASLSSARDIVADARVVRWAQFFRDGRHAELAEDVAAELARDDPHPFASHVWFSAEYARGVIPESGPVALPAGLDGERAEELELAFRIFQRERQPGHRDFGDLVTEALALDLSDYWALTILVWRAQGADLDQVEARAAAHWPDSFGIAWAIGNRDSKLDATGPGAGAAFRLWLARTPGASAFDKRLAVEAWLDWTPKDIDARRRVGYLLENTHDFERALEAFSESDATYPFHAFSAELIGRNLARLGRFEELERLAMEHANRLAPPSRRAAAAAVAETNALRLAGELGRARTRALTALETLPEDAELRVALARVVTEEKRPAEAVDLLLPVALADDGYRDAFELLAISLLDAGRPAEAVQASEAFAATGRRLNAFQIDDWARALRTLGRPGDAAAAADLLARDAPRATWALGNVGFTINMAAGPSEAFAYLADLLRAGHFSDWIAERLIAYAEAAGRKDDARVILEEAVRAYPHGEELWTRLAGISPDPMAVLAEARESAPRSAFPWYQKARRARGEDFSGWREALEILDAGIAALEADGVPEGELSRLLVERSIVRDTALQRRLTRDPREMQAGLADIDKARTLGLPARDYWLGRYLLLGRFGESVELTRAVVEAAALHETRAFGDLFREDVIANLRVPAYPFAALHAWVEREPRNSERLLEAANRHSMWGGSPVVALALIQRAERADPNARVASYRGRAYANLGLHREGYEALYARATSVADSDRYIGWEEKARRDARSPGNTLRSLDLETMRIVLRRADGIEEERRYHPETGKLTYLRVGAAWVEFDFVDGLEMSGVRTGGGRQALITYDDIPADPVDGRRVSGLVIDDEAAMRFAYSDRDHLAMIAIEGKGRLEFEYDDDGEIVSTASFPDTAGEESTLAFSVIRAYQSLQLFLGLGRERAGFADLPFEDPELDFLRREYETFAGTEDMLALAEGLVERRAAHPDNASELFRILDPFIHQTIETEEAHISIDATVAALHAIRLWHTMTRETLVEGLDPETWTIWTEMQSWAMSLDDSRDPSIAHHRSLLMAAIAAKPLRPLSTAGWLRASFLSNPGLWRHHRLGSIVPPALTREAAIEAVLIRDSGDLVVGTRRGLSVMQRGFFEWLPFDTTTGLLNPSLAYERLDGTSAVQALHEDEQGILWIGTRAGLMRIDGDYADPPTIWRAGSGGMPEGGIAAIVDLGDALVVGGPGGLALVDRAEGTVAAIDSQPVSWLRPLDSGRFVVGRQDGVEYGVPGALDLLAAERLDDIAIQDGRLLAIRGTQVLDAEIPSTGPAVFRILPEQETIDQAGRVFGFSNVPIFADETTLGVRTDQGVSLYRDGRFEHLRVPGRERIEPVTQLFARGTQLLVATPDGLSVMEEAQARMVLEADVRDMISRPDLGMTLVATGWSIEAIAHDDPFAEPMVLTYGGHGALASEPDGAVLANDFGHIVRLVIEPDGAVEKTVLFPAFPSDMPSGLSSAVRQILVARDGTIWVLAGPSVFRLAPGAQAPDEMSVFVDQQRFGANSDMLSRLIETSDGQLWLVASNEGHRSHRGVPLRGGLFAFDGDGFRKVELEGDARWFLTGYTPLPDRAIIGTTAGFATLRGMAATDFGRSDDASYRALRARLPALHLGTDGIDLGDGLYLFGTTGGVVGLQGGTWFYPERLNWMLPAQQHAAYGGRAIRRLATDPMGRIYMATDFGVTVYDPRGAGPEAFLINEGEGGFAFAALESRKMEEVRDILLDALPEDSDAGRRLSALREMRRQIAQLEAELDLERSRGGGQTARIERQVLQMRQRDIALLADLERNEPELFALVQVNPLDLQALRRDLPPGTVVLQYLPGRRTLFINLISRETQEIHRVDISAETLELRVRQAVEALAAQARGATTGQGLGSGLGGLGGLGGGGLGGGGLGSGSLGGSGLGGAGLGGLAGGLGGIGGGSTESDNETSQGLVADLGFLYDHLLRPVEHQLEAFESVLVAPTGALNYLPLGALVRDASGPRPRYAVEDTIFSKIPNLYAIQAMLQARPSSAFSHLVLGDPDGSLPHARLEASEIAEILGEEDVTLLVGDGASYEALTDSAAQARFVHLAMHGKLDHRDPRNSYLLLADGRRLTLPQIMTLPLSNVELVFLSACETGLGVDALEHRTIAQAFNHAGAPTVVAAHWEVNDSATRSLSKRFYGERIIDDNSARALARAQRAMILEDTVFAQPGYWAGFSVFGKP